MAVNDGPIAVTEDTPASGNVLTNDSDVDGPALSVTQFTIAGDATIYAAGSTASIAGVGSLLINADGSFTFTPAANYNGPVPTATYTLSDGSLTDTATLSFANVSAVNDAPTTSPVALAAIAQDSGPRLITQAQLLANASDVEGDSLTASNLTISSGAGSLVANGDGTWNYSPATGDQSAVSFAYSISDGSLSTPASASLDIIPADVEPLPAPTGQPPQKPPAEPAPEDEDNPQPAPVKPADAAPAGTPLDQGGPLTDGDSGLSPIDERGLAPILNAFGPADQGQARPHGHAALKDPTPAPNTIDLSNLDLSPLAAQFVQPALMKAAIDNPAFIQALNEMQSELDQLADAQTQNSQIKTEAVVGVSMSLTVGFISWILRTGTLMASFLAASPLWRQFDPLPILGSGAPASGDNGAKTQATKDSDAAETLFETQTRPPQDTSNR